MAVGQWGSFNGLISPISPIGLPTTLLAPGRRSGTLLSMPQFSTRTLLIACTLAAVWLASFSLGAFGADLRASMLLLVLVAAATCAACRSGSRRVFWASFTIVMILCGGLNLQAPLQRYIPRFSWQSSAMLWAQPFRSWPLVAPIPNNPPIQVVPDSSSSITYPVPYSPSITTLPVQFSGGPYSSSLTTVSFLLSETFIVAWILGLSTACGYLSVFIYSRPPQRATGSSASASNAQRIVEEELRNR